MAWILSGAAALFALSPSRTVGAQPLSNKVDAIRHSRIIVVLLGIAADDARAAVRVRDVAWAPPYYGGALAIFLALYYVGHEALYEGLAALPVI